MSISINEAYDSFRKLRTEKAYYIDKTQMLKSFLSDNFKSAVLFARPRRFGKTLTMTMFRDFLDIRQDSREIFQDLEIMSYPDIVETFMNRYPVIFFSMKEVFGGSFDEIFRNYQILIAGLFDDYTYLLDSDKVSSIHKEFFQKLLKKESSKEDTLQAVDLLCTMLYDHYKKPVFIIIDEYDVPMAKSVGTPTYEKVRDMVEHMLSYICKTNDRVKAVILSGCLFTVKNSTYTGVNNIIPYTILSPLYASSIGFTDENVKKLLSDAGIPEHYETVKEWYDGYLFGRERMYCPWDVLRYVSAVLDGSYSEAMGPENYWVNTSEIALETVRGFLGKTPGVMESFEALLAGKSIDCPVKDSLPYHRIHDRAENLWSALLETGYLTKAVTERMPLMPLRIPNKEIQDVFRQEIWEFFKDKVDNIRVRNLVNALWGQETEEARAAMDLILENTLSFYHEYHEYSYHLILAGFFTGLGYIVLSETETGYGRSDLIILDPARSRCLILELKHVDKESEMEDALKEANSQIIAKKYESRLSYQEYANRIKYGMVFWGKKSMIGIV